MAGRRMMYILSETASKVWWTRQSRACTNGVCSIKMSISQEPCLLHILHLTSVTRNGHHGNVECALPAHRLSEGGGVVWFHNLGILSRIRTSFAETWSIRRSGSKIPKGLIYRWAVGSELSSYARTLEQSRHTLGEYSQRDELIELRSATDLNGEGYPGMRE